MNTGTGESSGRSSPSPGPMNWGGGRREAIFLNLFSDSALRAEPGSFWEPERTERGQVPRRKLFPSGIRWPGWGWMALCASAVPPRREEGT